MLVLDHLVLIAPSLEEGAAYVEETLGVKMSPGGKHFEMGTHNRLLRLGEGVYLEAIAVDPDAPPPKRRRWFGLDDREAVRKAWDEGRRLRAWVARTRDLASILAARSAIFGESVRASRGGRTWDISIPHDGGLPLGGLAPSIIDWGPAGSPAPTMLDVGARLSALVVETPDPELARRLYRELGLVGAPQARKGPRLRYWAQIMTGAGARVIR